jgi:hypothetical protein
MQDERDDNGHPDPTVWWRHLRRGNYYGIYFAILQTIAWAILELYKDGVIEKMGPVISWSYGFCVIMVLIYGANTAVEKFVDRLPSR